MAKTKYKPILIGTLAIAVCVAGFLLVPRWRNGNVMAAVEITARALTAFKSHTGCYPQTLSQFEGAMTALPSDASYQQAGCDRYDIWFPDRGWTPHMQWTYSGPVIGWHHGWDS